MTNSRQEALRDAQVLADSLSSLAMQYQGVVRSGAEHAPEAETARRSLNRKFLKLKPQDNLEALRRSGQTEVARAIDELWKAAAMVFNLVAVSVGVDEVEVLDIDVEGPYAAAKDELAKELAT